MTNNPDKVRTLEEYGLTVVERVASRPRAPNRAYLTAVQFKICSLASESDDTKTPVGDG
jgi:GTP cyclohydrolase II